MLILGIETSCDETAAAIVSGERRILSNILLAQLDPHIQCGGVVPEVAARSHLDSLDSVIRRALAEADVTLDKIDAVAATGGPGLIGGVIVGVTTAKAISLALDIPFIAVNHLAGHALTARLTHNVAFPYLLLLVSGGHCQLVIVTSALDYCILGETVDDAVGEAFDKTARLLGLDYPGGPPVEKLARQGDPLRFSFPRPFFDKKAPEFSCTFSFSGLKTAVRKTVENLGNLTDKDRADCAASFQYAIGEILKNRVLNGLQKCREMNVPLTSFVVAGGVAANQYVRQALEKVVMSQDLKFIAPPLNLCTDNAAMIAWGGIEKMRLHRMDSLSFVPRSRWPLAESGKAFS